jgi:NADH:ubiquinone oxidoreductase subunit E
MKQQAAHTVTVCMGSSCFAHGNQEILEHVQKFLVEQEKSIEVELTGSLCQGKCKDGPSMMVNGKLHTRLTPEKAIRVLRDVFVLTGEYHEQS